MSHPTPDIPELAADATSEEEKTAEDAIIYPADSKGIEFAITVLDIYLSHGKEREIDQLVFEHIAKTIYKKFHGVTSFLGLDWKKGGTISFYSGHQLLPNMLLVNSDGSPLDWAQFMLQQQSRWTTAKLPTWSDTTFQAEKLEFIYPYFEGTTFIGVAVTNFESKINADVAPKIEVLLESARACYLEHLRHAGRRGEYQGKQNDTEKNKTGGLLGKFFGRKAA
jgi:hypothetical protein